MILALLLIPALSGVAAFMMRNDAARRRLLLGAAGLHALLTAAVWVWTPAPVAGAWLGLDAAGRLFLGVTSLLFLACACYAAGYLVREERGRRADFEEGTLFSNAPEAVFTGCLLLFLSTMTWVAMSRHFGLLWVAIEATTLASAPLIFFHRHHRSLEATWKYLMVCSVGIAVALLGNFLLAVAVSVGQGTTVPMTVDELVARAPTLHPRWLQAAFLCMLVGYGTKMGLAPLHTWLPDAHSEAPSVVSALLSGALLNCAFLGILRAHQVCDSAGIGGFSRGLLLGFGLLSMALAAVFIVGQLDFKRMLAYSSVEHMGILALGVGLGGNGVFGAMLHAVNHSLVKAMLFLLAGNVLAAYRTKAVAEVRGMLEALPGTGVMWMAGFLALTGLPPFGPFLSEFVILKAALDQGRLWVAAAYLGLLGVIFVGLVTAALRMAQGALPNGAAGVRAREAASALGPPAALGALALLLGLYLPPGLRATLAAAARLMGGP